MKKKPNIIFVFSDQQRWDTVGVYGQKLNITPNLDRLAREGVRFEHAFTCQPVCGPARACLQTGRYATETGCFMNGIALPLHEKTIAQYFSREGYETAYVGKWHLASTTGTDDYKCTAIPPERRGGYKDYWIAADVLEFTSDASGGFMFDRDMNRVDFQGYRADCTTDFALEFIRSADEQKPFFLFLSYIEPHQQNNHNRFEGPEGSREIFREYELPKDLRGLKGDYEEHYPDYLGACSSIDSNLGRIRTLLEEKGIEKDTIIFYASDHGCHFRTRNSEYKRSCHEASLRIPLIVWGGPFRGGKTFSELVSLIDLPPTLLKCADIEPPEQMKGRTLQTLLCKESKWKNEVFFQISESQVARGIRTEKWKYCIAAPDKNPIRDSDSTVYEEECLYDLENDYEERHNRISDPSCSEVKRSLKRRLLKRMQEAGEPPCRVLEK